MNYPKAVHEPYDGQGLLGTRNEVACVKCSAQTWYTVLTEMPVSDGNVISLGER